MVRPVWNPGAFQSAGIKRPFFEGWYYKLVSRNRREALALIPGIAVGKNGKSAFLQIFDGTSLEYRFIPYPAPLFKPHPRRFDITLGEHHFSDREITLAHRDCSLTLEGHLEIEHISPWPVKAFSPGAMGWYGLLPVMEDYHGVLSLDSPVKGTLQVDSRRYNFDGGRCYIEKDWGSGFPSAWIWMQCNHFQQEGVSVTFSLARIPWRRHWFSGFIIGILLEGRLYRFCTYTGARFESLQLTRETDGSGEDHTGFEARIRSGTILGKGRYSLHLKVQGGPKRALQAPVEGAMRSSVEESLSARCCMTLTDDRQGGRILFQGDGDRAGLEISGDIQQIIGDLAIP